MCLTTTKASTPITTDLNLPPSRHGELTSGSVWRLFAATFAVSWSGVALPLLQRRFAPLYSALILGNARRGSAAVLAPGVSPGSERTGRPRLPASRAASPGAGAAASDHKGDPS